MKYKIGQTVALLDTQSKPVGSAMITDINHSSHKYEVEYQVPGIKLKERVWVKQERLTTGSETDI